MVKKTKFREPDTIELGLIGVLLIWIFVTFYFLRQAATLSTISLVSWTSLTAFFTGFSSIVLIVIAILVADIRKEKVR